IQNGLGNYETLVEHVGRERAAVGVIYVGAQLVAGELRATGPGKVELGRPSGGAPRAKLDTLAELLRAGGMDVTVVDDPWPADGDRRDLRCGRARRRASWGPRSAQSGDDAARRLARLGRDGGLHLRVPIGLVALTEEPPRPHRTFSFDVDRPSRLAHEAILQELVG